MPPLPVYTRRHPLTDSGSCVSDLDSIPGEFLTEPLQSFRTADVNRSLGVIQQHREQRR